MARSANTPERRAGEQQFRDPKVPAGFLVWDQHRRRIVVGTGRKPRTEPELIEVAQ